jgi:hypothetical protein
VVPRSRLYNSNVLVPWFQARGDWSFAPGGSTQGFKKAGTSVKSVGKKVLKPAAKLKAARGPRSGEDRDFDSDVGPRFCKDRDFVIKTCRNSY